jgi:Astacin (Peptidase family M12A)
MKSVGLSLTACLFAGVLSAGPIAKIVDNSADIAVIDRALASEKRGDRWIKFGDVGVTRQQLLTFRDRLVAEEQGRASTRPKGVEPEAVTPPNTTFKWPGGNVYYRFDPTQVGNGTITAAKMQAVRDAMAEWAAFANLTFIENISGQPHYITYQEDPSLAGGFSSSVGMDPNNAEQFVKIGSNAWNRGTLCHETGHALGLWHEQQRDDRDTYVTINFSNIDSADQGNFTKLSGGTTAIGAYDFYSVMHYRRADLTNKPGTPDPDAPDPSIDTIDPTAPYVFFLNIMGNVYERTLSKLDRAGMAAIYGNPAVLPSAVVTNTKDSGPGSLRSAIYYAFDKSTDTPPVPTTVTFHIPTSDPNYDAANGVFTIKPTYLMVAPGAGTTIDGTTQTAFTGNTNASGPEIVIDGSEIAAQNLDLFAPGFLLRDMNCTIKSLVINGFNQQGIAINGTRAALFGTSASGNVITGCYIGTDRTGTVGIGNGSGWPGLELFGGAHDNTIGGTTVAARNIISGNTGHGIVIQQSGTDSNLIVGNYIGTTADGASALSNTFTGVAIFGGAKNNTVGGTTAGARNVLSGNKRQGFIFADSGTTGNVALGNYIGLNASGTAAVPNGNEDFSMHAFYPGAAIFNGAQNNVIGGTSAGSGNVISGNTAQGINIADTGTTGNLVQGNVIGTNPAGTAAIGNGFADPPNFYNYAGIAIFGGAQSNMIGGTASGAANVISGNAGQGVLLSDSGTSANLVQGNLIGTNADGTAAIANGYSGVGIFNSATSNTIGGLMSGARNLISGNANQGIAIANSGTNSNLVQGNFIGTNLAGSAALANIAEGIAIYQGAQSNRIGGPEPGARNVISGNGARGVGFFDSATANNLVEGNYIGLNATGTGAVANAFSGVEIYLGSNNTIGGVGGGMRNFISGNNDRGVLIDGANASGNVVQGNTIGLDVNGVPRPNLNQGVALFTGAHGNSIGGTGIGASNIISGNTNEAVALYDSTTIQNTVSENSIFSNGSGIVLNTSSNHSQAAPGITAVTVSSVTNPDGTDVSGNLSGSAGATFRIEFFANPAAGNEGQFFIGSTNVTTNGGQTNFTAALAAAVPPGYAITATATATSGATTTGDTSPFSAPFTVPAFVDGDHDSMPDNWELNHGLNTGVNDATADKDGDGMTNIQEYMAGTDPNSATSLFRVSSIVPNSGSYQIGFQSVLGKTYRLEYRDDLATGSWNTLTDQIFGTGATIQIVDPSAAGLTKRFYRFSLEP